MNNSKEIKYYTPKIEEFYIGFELEFFNNTNKEPQWKEVICDQDLINIAFTSDEEGTTEWQDDMQSTFRVHYLTREDIESLGWFYIKTNPGFLCFSFQINKTTFTLEFNPRDNSTIICFTNKQQEKRQHIFTGIIKNKSELSKLMKQLNISGENKN